MADLTFLSAALDAIKERDLFRRLRFIQGAQTPKGAQFHLHSVAPRLENR